MPNTSRSDGFCELYSALGFANGVVHNNPIRIVEEQVEFFPNAFEEFQNAF